MLPDPDLWASHSGIKRLAPLDIIDEIGHVFYHTPD